MASEELTAEQWLAKRDALVRRVRDLTAEGVRQYGWCGVADQTLIRMGVTSRSQRYQDGWYVQIKSRPEGRWSDYVQAADRERGMDYMRDYRERARRTSELRFVAYVTPESDMADLHRQLDELYEKATAESADRWPQYRLIYREGGRVRKAPEDGSPLPPLRPRRDQAARDVAAARALYEQQRAKVVEVSWRAADSHGQTGNVRHLLAKIPEVHDLLPELWALEIKRDNKWLVNYASTTDVTKMWQRNYRGTITPENIRVAYYPPGKTTPKRQKLSSVS